MAICTEKGTKQEMGDGLESMVGVGAAVLRK